MAIVFTIATLIGLGGLAWYDPRNTPKIFFTGVFIISLATLAMMTT